MVQVGDLIRYDSEWIDEDIERTPRKVDKIVEDVATGVRYAHLVPVGNNPETRLIEIDELHKEYDVVEEE